MVFFLNPLDQFARSGELIVQKKSLVWFGSDKAVYQETAVLFQTLLLELMDHVKCYMDYMRDRATNIEEGEEKAQSSRLHILTWEDKTKSFLKELCKRGEFPFPDWKMYRRSCKLIALEELTHSSLPLNDFLILASTEQQKPSSHFDKWFETVKEKDIRTLHKGLIAACELIKTIRKNADLDHLEFRISRIDKKPFMQRDKKCLEWREKKNVPGFTLEHNLSHKNENDDKWVFEIKERKDVVLVLPQNRAVLQMRAYSIEKFKLDVFVSYFKIDPKGRFALMEKLLNPIEGVLWHEKKVLEASDCAKLNMHAKLIVHLLQLGYTPSQFDYLRVDSKGRFKTLKVYEELPFDFDRIEREMIYKASQTNVLVYKYLVQESQMDKHLYAEFYEKVVNHAAEGKKIDIDDFGRRYRAVDSAVAHAKELFKQVEELKKACLNASPSIIKECYKNGGSIGRLWPSFQGEIMTKVAMRPVV